MTSSFYSDQRGFTLLEVLLSVGIITILAGLSLPIYASFSSRNDLDIATESLAGALRRAENYSRAVKADSQWGINAGNGKITVFKGASYATRDSNYDEDTNISAAITVGGSSEIVFSKLSGLPTSNTTTTLFSSSANRTKTVTVNAKGMVDY